MAGLTLFQEITLIEGGSPRVDNLEALVYQSAVGAGVDFLTTHKLFVAGDFPLAQAYVNKVVAVANRVNRKTDIGNTIDSFRKVFIALMGDQFTLSQIEGASDTQWAGFINSNMLQVFEIVGGVLQTEKAQYTGI